MAFWRYGLGVALPLLTAAVLLAREQVAQPRYLTVAAQRAANGGEALRVPLAATRFTPQGYSRGWRLLEEWDGVPRRTGPGPRADPSGRLFVLDDAGKVRSVPVRVGPDDGALVEVSGDELREGDAVLVGEQGSVPAIHSRSPPRETAARRR